MKFSIKIFLSLFLIIGTVANAADTASILPPAKTTFVDQNGKPLTSGTVDFYIPSTTTRKATWQDAGETILNTNPVVLDGAGRALILGSGSYRQVVKDRLGNIIWDQVTSSVGSGGTPTTGTGDGDLVGTIKPWAGMSAPNQYMFTYGQELSRTTYATLFTAITSSQAIFCTSGSPVLSGLSDTTNFNEGAPVEVSCVTGGNTTIIAKTSTTVTLAVNANVSTNAIAVFFPWGHGNGVTTFNIPDIRGVAPIGNNNMGGVPTALITSTYFGTNPNSIGAIGGAQITSLINSNVPLYTPTGTITNGSITSLFTGLSGQTGLTGTGGSQAYTAGGFASSQITGTVASTQATSTFTGASNGGGSVPFSRIQPSVTTNYIIKVLPDSNAATASGVTSLGGMTGDIACGTGLLCTGNVISSSFTNPVTGPSSSVVGNLAIFNNTTGNLLASVPTYQSGNIANAAIISGVPNRTIGLVPTYNGFYFYQGTPFTAVKQSAQDLHSLQQAFVVSNSIATGDPGSGIALGVYSESNSPDPSNSIAIYGQSQANVAGGSIFTTNFIAQNIADNAAHGLNANYITPMELNPNKWLNVGGTNTTVSGNHFYGLNIQGGGNHTDEIGSAIVINNSAVPAVTRWATGVELIAGCCITGVSIGQLALGNNQGSANFNLLSRDAGGTVRTATMLTDPNASLYFLPAANAALIFEDGNGNVLGEFQATSIIGGNTGFQLNQVAAIGVLKTSVTGVVSSSLALPSGMSAPAFTVTGSFTATGLVTNADLVNQSTTVNSQVCTLGSTCTITASATSMTVGTTTVISGTTTRVLFDNAGVLGEYSISGTGSVAMTTSPTFITPNLGTVASGSIATTLLSGTLQAAQEPAHTGDVTNAAGSLALTLATAQPAVHTWALAQTFTVAPVFTDASGTRTALGLGVLATVTPGTGIATWLTTPSSANLIAALTDETGTGSAVFGTSPVLSTVDARGTWTTGTSWTLPAHTWNGTVAGGGNQLNNVIIGTTTPLMVNAASATFSPLTSSIEASALRFSGNFGGGIVLADGSARIAQWSQSAGAEYHIGFGTATGATDAAVYTATKLLLTGSVQTGKSTVASLPTCNAAAEGAQYGVTDALAPTFLGTLVGGGTVHTSGYCNGTNWVGG